MFRKKYSLYLENLYFLYRNIEFSHRFWFGTVVMRWLLRHLRVSYETSYISNMPNTHTHTYIHELFVYLIARQLYTPRHVWHYDRNISCVSPNVTYGARSHSHALCVSNVFFLLSVTLHVRWLTLRLAYQSHSQCLQTYGCGALSLSLSSTPSTHESCMHKSMRLCMRVCQVSSHTDIFFLPIKSFVK